MNIPLGKLLSVLLAWSTLASAQFYNQDPTRRGGRDSAEALRAPPSKQFPVFWGDGQSLPRK
jgi:hypothetical protein